MQRRQPYALLAVLATEDGTAEPAAVKLALEQEIRAVAGSVSAQAGKPSTVSILTVTPARLRFIPACAGNGPEGGASMNLRRPGAKVNAEIPATSLPLRPLQGLRAPSDEVGSSPRVRGTRSKCYRAIGPPGAIRPTPRSRHRHSLDPCALWRASRSGSSPRVRGTGCGVAARRLVLSPGAIFRD